MKQELCRLCLSTVVLKPTATEVSTLNLSTKLWQLYCLSWDVEVQTSNENKN